MQSERLLFRKGATTHIAHKLIVIFTHKINYTKTATTVAVPHEDAVNYSSDFIHELELVQADTAGSAIPVSGRQGAQYALAVRATYGDGTSSGVITEGVSYWTSDPDVLLVRDASGKKTLLFAGPGDATITATYKGATSSPISIHVTQ